MLDTKRTTGWDRLRLHYRSLASAGVLPSMTADQRRMFLHRTPPFEEVLSAPDPAAQSATLASAHKELDTRLARWRTAAALNIRSRRVAGIGGYIGFFVVIYFILPLIGPLVLLLIFALMLLLIPRWIRRAKLGRLLAFIQDRQCPECAYDLTGAVPAAPAAGALGPPTCPECGAAWPLIPAAVLT
jgi:hypothetical protein